MTKSTLKNPKLRFPEFEENWRKARINQLTERVSIPVEVEANESYTQIGIRSHGKGLFHKEPVAGKELGNKRVFWVKEDLFVVNIVFAWEQAVGKTTKDELGTIASHRFPMLSPKADLLDLDFLLFSFLTKRGKSLLELASPGGAGRNKTLGQEEFNRTKISLPGVEEQKLIVGFLLAVNEKITQLAKKKELLLKYRRGVMQQIFSQKIRFKNDNGNNFPDWKEKPISGVCRILYGKDQKGVSAVDGIYPILGTGGIIGKTNKFLYDKASVLIGRKGTIDRPRYMDTPFWTVDTLFYTEIFETSIPKWLFYQFEMINWYAFNEASGVPSLSATTISRIKIQVPDKPEQEKIVTFLSAVDEKVRLVHQQLEKMKTFKKGLLQQMFV